MVEAPGFKKLEQKGIVIVTQTANTQDAKLDIGQVTETINVTAEAELLNTSEASTGTDIDRQKMEDLPNLGRDPFMLARLSEGVVWTGNPKFDRMEDQSGQSQMSIAGGPIADQQLHAGRRLDYRLHQPRGDYSGHGSGAGNEGSGQHLRRVDGTHGRRRFQCDPALRHRTGCTVRCSASFARPAGWPTTFSPTRRAFRLLSSAVQELRRFAGRPGPNSENLRRPE